MVTLNHLVHIPFMKLTFSHQRMDGWKVILLGVSTYFQIVFAVSFKEIIPCTHILHFR